MKLIWKDVLTAAFLGLILPGILLNAAVSVLEGPVWAAEAVETEPVETGMEDIRQPMRLRYPGGIVAEEDMDRYLTGVLLAEMPASFEPEALKAQSVAARTYTQRSIETGGKHGDGSVCTQSGCCQAYLTEEAYLARGGIRENIEKVSMAVAATSGQVLTFEDTLIEATYFSCSGGYTEDAVAVWGTEIPYLQSRPSLGEEQSPAYVDTVCYTPREFQNALGVMLEGPPEHWFGAVTYTEGGGVELMDIGGLPYTGTQLRSLLALRSTAFTVSASEEGIYITTRGYGHRVGLSQYGANAMALKGSSYGEILAYYYPGTVLATIEQREMA